MDPHGHWDAKKEVRFIEMIRREHTLEEIARELSLPLDLVEAKVEAWADDDASPDPPS